MKIDPELEARILATPGVVVRGVAPVPPPKGKRAKPKLLPPSFQSPATWVVPVYVCVGDNMGGRDRHRKIGRAGHERWAVHKAMGREYGALTWLAWLMHEQGERVRVTLTRLGPRKLDYMNAIASLKYVQDAVAERFGVDDGSPLYEWDYGQETADAYGVRITVGAGHDHLPTRPDAPRHMPGLRTARQRRPAA